jgi:hypothetical protein
MNLIFLGRDCVDRREGWTIAGEVMKSEIAGNSVSSGSS